MKKLLIVYHSQSGSTQSMAEAVLKGTAHPDIEQSDVEVRFLKAKAANLEDLLWCDGLILGTPENFGYMSGALKDFFDRTFYAAEGKVEGLPYCLFVKAGNDGSGAVNSIHRIVNGYSFREVQAPLLHSGEVTEEALRDCQTLGMTMAAGLIAGIF